MGKREKQEELLSTLGDFTSKENWDKFFTIRGGDDSFEWYAEWPQLRDLLVSQLSEFESSSSSRADAAIEAPSPSIQILVPGCGNSRLSEHLYDAGFRCITNIDFSKVVVSEMLRRNVRLRPEMRWRVMDMTSMEFVDSTFDIVLDKGGLDALMEPERGWKLGNQYLSEIKRVLKNGGKFLCLTLAESHVLGLLFPKFRHGWNTRLHLLPHKSSEMSSLRTFLVIAEKGDSTILQQISPSFDISVLDAGGDQAHGLVEALETENKIRVKYSNGSDIVYSIEDMRLGIKGDLADLSPGRRVQLFLGELGQSHFVYRAVLLDAQQQADEFSYTCGVFLVPKTRAHEWLFSSEEGQWMVVKSSKSARLIIVFLDSCHSRSSMDDIQKDLSPLVKQLTPRKHDTGAPIPFMAASDGIKERRVVFQATSSLTGPVVIEDVVYEEVDGNISHQFPSKDPVFRRLTFQRSASLVQSEALLKSEGLDKTVGEKSKKKSQLPSKSRNRGSQRRKELSLTDGSSHLKVDHDYLASSYHMGIVSGFLLISSHLERVALAGKTVRTIVIGLGAGLLPMFLHGCNSFLSIEVVELDPVVLELARNYFGFREDERLGVHIADGIQFVKNVNHIKAADRVTSCDENGVSSSVKASSSNGGFQEQNERNMKNDTVDILIVDVDSSDLSFGLTCPAADFVEDSFLLTVKSSLSEQGLFVINLVSRSSVIKDSVVSRIKEVFLNVFSLQLEEDVNEVIFALNVKVCIDFKSSEATHQFEKLLKLRNPAMSQCISDAMEKIRCLK